MQGTLQVALLCGFLGIAQSQTVAEVERQLRKIGRERGPNLRPTRRRSTLAAAAFSRSSPSSRAIAAQSELLLKAAIELGLAGKGRRKPRFPDEIRNIAETRGLLPESTCVTVSTDCELEAAYRTADGTCNNLEQPDWGAANSPFQRLLPNAYEDDFDAPRSTGVGGEVLPGPRAVSLAVHGSREEEGRRASHMVMQWGQFLDHDVTLTPVQPEPAGSLGTTIDCEPCDSGDDNNVCLPIPVPSDDPVFPSGHCLNFRRSQGGGLVFGEPREQLNAITAYIDSSNVYGSDDGRASELRDPVATHLLATSAGGLLPKASAAEEPSCPQAGQCARAGDVRVNVQAGLGSMHTLWLSQHNKLAAALKKLNPSWDADKVYQEARKIVGAQNQWITYNEFLPTILGPRMTRKYKLDASPRHAYDAACNAGLDNEFAAAAFRFGHSAIRALFKRQGKPDFALKGNFNDPSFLNDGGKENMLAFLLGFGKDKCNKIDEQVTSAMRDHLFGSGTAPDGLDIISLNIQRGRDHGLQPYLAYRKKLGLSAPADWAGLAELVGPTNAANFQKVYKSPADIDLFSGIVSEPKVRGGMIGRLGAEMLGRQFKRLKFCDRFWFQWRDGPWSLSRRQIVAIKATTLGKVLCDHVGAPDTQVPLDAFHVGGRQRGCSPSTSVQSLDLSGWKEGASGRPPRRRGGRTRGRRQAGRRGSRRKTPPRCFVEADVVVHDEPVLGGPPFISEFHTDNVGTDVGEFVELTHHSLVEPVDNSKYCLILINGFNKKVYDRRELGFSTDNNFVVVFKTNGIQNGGSAPDCLAVAECATSPEDNDLVTEAHALKFSQFICYEGSVTIGSVVGKDIGVEETGSTPIGHSVQACPGQLGGDCWTVQGNTKGSRNTDGNIADDVPNGPPFISEFHTDNKGTDVGEFVELTHPSQAEIVDNSKHCLLLINGFNKTVYDSSYLGFSSANNFVVEFKTNGIQNGGTSPDCLAVAECATAPEYNDIVTEAQALKFTQFLCYEGSVTIGSVVGKDIGVKETSSTPIGHSVQACAGELGGDCWAIGANTKGARNTD